jgi:siroheme synthase
MGLGHLEEIVQHLMTHGRAPETPVAVIHAGTTPTQTVVQGTLQDIAAGARGIPAPATIVIGQVVNLRQHLAWFTPETSDACVPSMVFAATMPLPVEPTPAEV